MLTATAPTILRIANDTLFTSGKFNDENGWVGMDYFARFDAKKSVGVKVADAQQDDALQVWPNPASNFLVVETQGGGNSPLQIITLQGEIAAEYAVEDHTLLPITHLPVGTYLLRIGERTTPVTIKR